MVFVYFCTVKSHGMNQALRETEFVIFGIENTALRLNVSGADVYRELLASDGISSFLYPSYQALHTQGKDYIVDEIIQYIERHNPAFVQKEGVVA